MIYNIINFRNLLMINYVVDYLKLNFVYLYNN